MVYGEPTGCICKQLNVVYKQAIEISVSSTLIKVLLNNLHIEAADYDTLVTLCLFMLTAFRAERESHSISERFGNLSFLTIMKIISQNLISI